MPLKYNPKDANNKLIADGEYDAQVVEAEQTKSKAGADMLKLTVKVWAHGDSIHLLDYIVVPTGLWKLQKLMAAIGLGEKFNGGEVEPKELLGKNMIVFVTTKKQEGYADSNIIKRYSPSAPASGSQGGPAGPHGDDDLAF